MKRNVLEICAGGGGQALGLEHAGFEAQAVIEIDVAACETLKRNRPHWSVLQEDLKDFNAHAYEGIDLLSGGVPCPPFSVAGKQLGENDERDLFPTAIRLVKQTQPKAVMLENVRGFSSNKFSEYRRNLFNEFLGIGYSVFWAVLNASDYGVPQLRPRFIMVALKHSYADFFSFPSPCLQSLSVGNVISDLMAERGWSYADKWSDLANGIAPTIVGGSKKHGGADLGPSRAKAQWLKLGVDGKGIANEAPGPECGEGYIPRLTNKMVARIQGFPDSWRFCGKKTSVYRQIGNAFPPPVAAAVGKRIYSALNKVPLDREAGEQFQFGWNRIA